MVRTLAVGTCVIALLAVSALLDRDSGVGIWLELREDLARSKARVAQLVRENEHMRREIQSLEAEPSAIERAIREELDVALPGEVVVRFTSQDEVSAERPDRGSDAWRLPQAVRRVLGDREQP